MKNKNGIVLVFGGRIPSKKDGQSIRYKFITKGGRRVKIPFITAGDRHRLWHSQQIDGLKILARQLKKEGYKLPLEHIYSMATEIVFSDKRHADLINKVESLQDILVDAGILKDDNCFVLPRVEISYRYAKNNGGARVTLKLEE